MTGWFLANMAWASLAMLLVLAVRRPFAAAVRRRPGSMRCGCCRRLRLVAPPLPAWARSTSQSASAADTDPVRGGCGRAAAAGRRTRAVGALAARDLGRRRGRLPRLAILAYRRFLAELDRGAREPRRPSRPAADRERGGRRGRSRSACSAAGSSCRPISRAAIRRRSARSRSTMRPSTTAAATSGGTISACSSLRSTGSIRSPGSPSGVPRRPGAGLRRRRRRRRRARRRATIMRAP